VKNLSRRGPPIWVQREEATIREGSQRRAYAREIEKLKKRIEELEANIKILEEENKQLKAQLRNV